VVWQATHRVAGDLRGDDSPWYNGAMDELAIWNIVLTEDEINKSINAARGINDEALVLYYSFEEIQGDTVKDLSGNGYDGEISGNPNQIDGKQGKALFFEGKGVQEKRQYVDIEGILPLGDKDITAVLWVKVPPDSNGGGTNRVGILLGNYNSPNNYNLEIHGNGQPRIWWNNGQHDHKGKQDLRDDEWHHLAFVRDKKKKIFVIYVDGEVDSEFKGSAGADVVWQKEHRVAGDLRGDGSPWYNGAIDELAIWSIVLTEGEIKGVMKGIKTPVSPAGKLVDTWGEIKKGKARK